MYRLPPENSEAFRLMGDPARAVEALDPKRAGELLFASEALDHARASIAASPVPRPQAIVVICRALVFAEDGRVLLNAIPSPINSPLAVDKILLLVRPNNCAVLHNFSRDPDGRKLPE